MAKSYYVRYERGESAKRDGKLLLGGVTASESSRFSHEQDAVARARTIVEVHAGMGVVVDFEVKESRKRPEIVRHCEGFPAQVVGCRCFGCGKVVGAKP
jgi:hypothetical protein